MTQSEAPGLTLIRAITEVRALVFDWNGTILDDAGRALCATNSVLAMYAMPALNEAQFRETFLLPMDRYFLSLGVPGGEVEAAILAWNRALGDGPIRLSAGVLEMFEAARDRRLPVAIVSAASEAVVRLDASRLGVEQFLTTIIGNARSKSLALWALSESLGAPLLYCGDTEYDISEARVAGAIPVGFGAGYRPALDLERAGPIIVIHDFFEVAAALSVDGPRRD